MGKLGIALILLALFISAHADTTITYQGKLQDGSGTVDDIVEMSFALFDDEIDGNQVGDTIILTGISVVEGLFQVELDFGQQPYASGLWLAIEVEGSRLAPRQAITGAPFAISGASGSGSHWELSGSDIHFSGGNVGIGTDSPSVALDVVGSAKFGYSGNEASGENSFVTGGWDGVFEGTPFPPLPNYAQGRFSFVGGGAINIANGYASFVGGGDSNTTNGGASFVGGGRFNTANGSNSFVAGGDSNTTGGIYSFVGGGLFNTANGASSFVAGGQSNTASGDRSFAAGRQAYAEHDGTFVWADDTNANFSSQRENQFRIRATGGAEFQTGAHGLHTFSSSSNSTIQAESDHPDGRALTARNDSTEATMILNNRGTGRLIRAFNVGTLLMQLENNGNMWIAGALTQNSDREQKEAIEPVDVQFVLDRLTDMEISSWRYLRSDNGVRHIGPMAQDFHAAFGFGVSETSISAVDAQGIAFAAIQALNERLMDSNAELQRDLAAMQAEHSLLQARLEALEAFLLDGEKIAEQSR